MGKRSFSASGPGTALPTGFRRGLGQTPRAPLVTAFLSRAACWELADLPGLLGASSLTSAAAYKRSVFSAT